MSQSKWDDLYDRLTSRKLWLALLSIVLAAYGHFSGHLTYVEFQTAVFGAVGLYTVSEAATDAAAAWHSSPDTTVRTTVNTGTEAPVAAKPPTRIPARRVRPSRAKPKPAEGGNRA